MGRTCIGTDTRSRPKVRRFEPVRAAACSNSELWYRIIKLSTLKKQDETLVPKPLFHLFTRERGEGNGNILQRYDKITYRY